MNCQRDWKVWPFRNPEGSSLLCWGRSSRPRFCFFCGFWKQRIMQTHWVAQGSASRACCLVGDTAQLSQTKIAPGVRSLLIWWWWLDFSSAICCGHISIWNRRSIALFVSSSPISLEGYNTLGSLGTRKEHRSGKAMVSHSENTFMVIVFTSM